MAFIHLTFFFLVSGDLRLDRFPINLNVPRILLHPLIVLFPTILLQESLPVRNNRIHVCLVLHGNIHSPVPSVQTDVQFDSPVEKPSLKQDGFCFRNPLLVHQHSRLAGWLRSELLLDVVDVLNLVSLIYLS